jgi:hypothetical protein
MELKKYTEKEIEQYLIEQIAKLGGEAYKFVSPNRRAVLDRLCVMPAGIIAFIEVKATGKQPSDAQFREIDRLQNKGHYANWVNSKKSIDDLIKHLKRKMTKEEINGKL